MLANVKVDLHIHSYASDGTWPTEKIINSALDKEIMLISITDHDEIKMTEEAVNISRKKKINYLKGVEISSTLNGELFHILAYGIDVNNKELNKLLENNRNMLDEKDDNTIKYLINNGYNIDFQKYLNYENDPTRGGWKALNFLIDEKLCIDVGDYFGRLFKDKHEIQFPEFPHPEEVIRIIKRADGIPILAHPYYTPIELPVAERLGVFKEIGIDGFECFHPNHSKDITRLCLEWCKKNNTIITAGSDCHGDFIKTRRIGEPIAYIEDINLGKLKDYII
jgi:predicted metal-dependent phosphoesterase TrpH